jgi:DNA helicase II / ATP-dependent DNA helicase PcrA
VTLVDWRSSALGAACLRHAPGERYEIEVRGRRGSGVLVSRTFVTFDDHGALVATAAPPTPVLLPDDELPSGRLPMVRAASAFDDRQRQAFALPADRPLLISGGAGSGKTTVALHRLARLHRADSKRFPRRDLQVIAAEPALARMAAAVLLALGLGQVDVATAEAWLARQARRVLLDRPEVVLATPALVVALKRHPALRRALPAFVDDLGRQLAERLDRRLAERGRVVARWAEIDGAHLLERLDRLEAALVEATRESLRHEVVSAVRKERQKLSRVRSDLVELFGDSARMAAVVADAGGELSGEAAATVVAHTRAQLRATSDERFADVDRERRQAVDALGLDEGTPDELAHTGDPEDDAVALELLRLKTGAYATSRNKIRAPRLLLLDEAQDLAAIELGVLGNARREGSSVTLSGDDAQEMARGAAFPGWATVLEELHAEEAEHIALVRNHRSRAPIVAFANAVLGPLARDEAAAAPGGPPVVVTPVADAARAALLAGTTLLALRERRPAASIAVLCSRADTARALHGILPPDLGARLALGGDASRFPGVVVTTVLQVKGLEFDVVVVPDASAEQYGDDDGARRRLYVACSRAIEQLWVICPGRRSPLVPGED